MDVESKGPDASGAASRNDSQYLASSGVGIHNADKRPRRDFYWTVSYCLLAALTVLWGIVAFVHTDPNAGLYTNSFYYQSTTCDVQAFMEIHPTQEDDETADTDPTFMRAFKKSISIWLPITAALSVVSSAVYLLLFRRFARFMVMASIYASLSLGLLFAIVCLATGAVPFGIILLICTVVSGLFYYWIRAQLRMCADLMAIAGRGLNENLGLVPAAVAIKFAGLCVLTYSCAAFFSALNIGHAEQSTFDSIQVLGDENAQCYDRYGNVVPCCGFVTKGWAGAYAFFAAVFISWSAMLIMQIKLYTVADTISQWYFSASATGSASVTGVALTSGSVRMALRHCLTTSFGSVAFAAAILALLRAVRSALERAARNNIICCIINCFAQPLLAMMEKFTRFATIATAITGQAFVPAAHTVYDTLKRNFLQTYSMWWVPDSVLGFTVTLMSLTWAGIVFFSTYGMNKSNDQAWGIAFAVAACGFFLMLYTLMFVAGLLLDTVNTLYICYALDKDQRRVTHPEIHAIYMQIPGLAVENPDGAVMYGAPEPQPAQAAVHPPPPYAGAYTPVQQTAVYPASAYPASTYPSYPPQPPPGGYSYVQTDRV